MKRDRGMAMLSAGYLLVCCLSAPAEAVRPKVGLVLGGGGALGEAHVGVLRAFEEMQIPIDYIGGTSMGAIISGLYAAGMSPAEIEEFLRSQDWWDVLNDRTPRRELEFRRKKDDQRYFIELGWRHGLRIGRGAAAGQKFSNILQTETLRSLTITNFNDLPVPFRAVATDLRSGERVVLDHGNLATAMRASMAVPGVFTPVDWEGRILVDGGVVDNIPVDVVRQMGADIIIAVDVGGSEASAQQQGSLDSLGQVLSQTYNIMHRPSQEAQLKRADMIITPDLTSFTASDFQRVAKIVPRGSEAAWAMRDRLKDYSVDEETFRAYLRRQRRARPRSIPVSQVVLAGNNRVDSRVARGRVRSKAGEPLDLHQVNLDLLHLYGLGEFEQVLYRIHPATGGSNTLEYVMLEKITGPNYIHVGLRLRSDFDQDAAWGLLLNVRKASINRLGGEWENELEMGSRYRVLSEFYQPLNFAGYLFIVPSVEYRKDVQGIYSNAGRVAEYDVRTMELRGDVGVQLRHYAELRAGPLWRYVKADVRTGEPGLPDVDEHEGGWFVRLAADRLDQPVFSRKGYALQLQAEFIEEAMGNSSSYEKFAASYRQFFSFGDHTLALNLSAGTDRDTGLPAYNQFILGGESSFAGLAEGELRGDKFSVAGLSYRYRLMRLPPSLGKAVYTMLRFDTGNIWSAPEDIDLKDLRYGGGIGLGADTVIGPVYVGYGMADRGATSFYFSLGSIF